jgi:hypothetical protein
MRKLLELSKSFLDDVSRYSGVMFVQTRDGVVAKHANPAVLQDVEDDFFLSGYAVDRGEGFFVLPDVAISES